MKGEAFSCNRGKRLNRIFLAIHSIAVTGGPGIATQVDRSAAVEPGDEVTIVKSISVRVGVVNRIP